MSSLGNHVGSWKAKVGRTNIDRAHRYKQDVEKSYVLQRLIQQEKQVKETKNEKVQEV